MNGLALSTGTFKSSRFHVAECDLGKGVFAAKDLATGAAIFTFSGPILSLKEVLAKGEQAAANPVQIDKGSYIDVGSPGVFINHSCEPNAGVVRDVRVVALSHIAKDEEIRFDYSTTMSEGLWTMQCKCPSRQCRGMVTDFHELPAALQAKYLAWGIVQRFIVKECRRMMDAVELEQVTGLRQALRLPRFQLAVNRGEAVPSARW